MIPLHTSKKPADLLVFLLLISTFFPIFASYVLLSIVLLLILHHYRSQLCRRPSIFAIKSGFVLTKKYLSRGLAKNLAFYLLCISVSTCVSYFYFSEPPQSFLAWIKPLKHYYLKFFIIWIVLDQGVKAFPNLSSKKPLIEKYLTGFLAILFCYAIAQRWFGFDLTHGLMGKLPEHRMTGDIFRVSGFMSHPLTFAYNLSITIFTWAIIFLFSIKKVGFKNNLFTLAILFLSFFLLYLSMSRWALVLMIGFLFILALLYLPYKFKYLFFVLACISLGTLLMVDKSLLMRFKELGNIQNVDRFVFWRAHLHLFKQSILVGIGPKITPELLSEVYASLNYYDKIYSAHNIFIQTLANFGLMGFVGLIGFFTGVYRRLKNTLGNLGNPQFVATMIIGLMVASGLMQNTLLDSEYLYCLFINIHLLALASENTVGEKLKKHEFQHKNKQS